MGLSKIGIFAGVFDPIHLGHTDFIKRAIEQDGLDKVYVLIEQEPKYKTCIAPYKHRREMVRLATSKIPKTEIYESKAKFFPITSSLPDIKKANPTSLVMLLLGDDVAARIGEWQNGQELQKEVGLIIAQRGKTGDYADASSLKIRKKIAAGEKPELDDEVLKYCLDNKLY